MEEETEKRNTPRGSEVISDQRLAEAGSSSNGSGTYSSFPESFSPSHSFGLHEMTPSVNVLRKSGLGIFLWSTNTKQHGIHKGYITSQRSMIDGCVAKREGKGEKTYLNGNERI